VDTHSGQCGDNQSSAALGKPDSVSSFGHFEFSLLTGLSSEGMLWDNDVFTQHVLETLDVPNKQEIMLSKTIPTVLATDPTNNSSLDHSKVAPVNEQKEKLITKKFVVGQYTEAEITKLHHQWNHCPAGQLLRKIKHLGLPCSRLNFQKIDEILQKCENKKCQELRSKPKKPQGSGLVPKDRNHIVCMDTFYPDEIPKFAGGVQHQIDALTRISVLTLDAGKGASTRDTCRASDIWDMFYGPPRYRLTDNGPEYGQDFTDRQTRCGTEHKTTPTYAAFSNGIVERAHQKAKYLLKILAPKFTRATGQEILNVVQVALNSEVKNNGRTPFEMTLGRPLRQPDFDENIALWEDAMEDHQLLREEMLNEAKLALLQYYTDVSVKKALKAKLVRQMGSFTVGDRVWYYRMGRSDKKDGWFGPAKVLAINGRLVIIQYGSICSIVHDTRIRPYLEDKEKYLPPVAENWHDLPPQQVGRHLVQNQGKLKLEIIRPRDTEPGEVGDELEVVDPLPREGVPQVLDPTGANDIEDIEDLNRQQDQSSVHDLHTPDIGPRRVERFDIGTGGNVYTDPSTDWGGVDTPIFSPGSTKTPTGNWTVGGTRIKEETPEHPVHTPEVVDLETIKTELADAPSPEPVGGVHC
jgi:hypothetical protein